MSIEERRNLVVSFLKKCVKYANDSIDRKTERVSKRKRYPDGRRIAISPSMR